MTTCVACSGAMSLKLPRKVEPKMGRIRRYSDRMITGCKDLAAECTVRVARVQK